MIELLAQLPDWLQVLTILAVVGMLFLIKPGVNAYNSWRKNKAETRKIDTETDLKLIERYEKLLRKFEATVEKQETEIGKLQADNQRLHEVTNSLIREAGRLHDFMKGCLDQLRDNGVPTAEIPAIPELTLPDK